MLLGVVPHCTEQTDFVFSLGSNKWSSRLYTSTLSLIRRHRICSTTDRTVSADCTMHCCGKINDHGLPIPEPSLHPLPQIRRGRLTASGLDNPQYQSAFVTSIRGNSGCWHRRTCSSPKMQQMCSTSSLSMVLSRMSGVWNRIAITSQATPISVGFSRGANRTKLLSSSNRNRVREAFTLCFSPAR